MVHAATAWRLLRERGFHVLAAGSGAEALDQFRYHPLEAVILDILMPGMSGLEALERFHTEDPDVPIIMLTADTRSQSVITALKLGAFDFLVKGLDSELVALAVHRAVRHRRQALSTKREMEALRARIATLESGHPMDHPPVRS